MLNRYWMQWIPLYDLFIKWVCSQTGVPIITSWICRPISAPTITIAMQRRRYRWWSSSHAFLHGFLLIWNKGCNSTIWIHFDAYLYCKIHIQFLTEAPWKRCCSHRLRACLSYAANSTHGQLRWCAH
jgi:hypothetical protein